MAAMAAASAGKGKGGGKGAAARAPLKKEKTPADVALMHVYGDDEAPVETLDGGDKRKTTAATKLATAAGTAAAEVADESLALAHKSGDPVAIEKALKAVSDAKEVQATAKAKSEADKENKGLQGGGATAGKSKVEVEVDVHGKPMFHYGKKSPLGPDRWGSLTKDYAVCGNGVVQSPVDIRFDDLAPANANVVVDRDLQSFAVHLPPFNIGHVLNDGHAVSCTFGGLLGALCV